VILEAVQKMPDDATFEQVREEIEIPATLHRARQASAEGRVFSVKEARQGAGSI
jgi:hypothetical protein